MEIRPKNDFILVERNAPDKTSAGGIIIPDSGQRKSQEGVVVAIGKKVTAILAQGDKVVFGAFAGSEFRMSGKDYILMREHEILLVRG